MKEEHMKIVRWAVTKETHSQTDKLCVEPGQCIKKENHVNMHIYVLD